MAATNLGAIIARFDSSPAYALAQKSQGAWMGGIPEQFSDQNLPFCALRHDGDFTEYTTETGYREYCRFHWECYGAPLAQAENLATAIKTAFDLPDQVRAHTAFQIDNAEVFTCRRPDGQTGYKVDVVGERLSTGELVFLVTVTYVMGVNKVLTG